MRTDGSDAVMADMGLSRGGNRWIEEDSVRCRPTHANIIGVPRWMAFRAVGKVAVGDYGSKISSIPPTVVSIAWNHSVEGISTSLQNPVSGTWVRANICLC